MHFLISFQITFDKRIFQTRFVFDRKQKHGCIQINGIVFILLISIFKKNTKE